MKKLKFTRALWIHIIIFLAVLLLPLFVSKLQAINEKIVILSNGKILVQRIDSSQAEHPRVIEKSITLYSSDPSYENSQNIPAALAMEAATAYGLPFPSGFPTSSPSPMPS